MMTTVADVSKNVDWAIEEARRHIDQQLTATSQIDSRAATFLGLIGGVTGVTGVFGNVNLETPLRLLATGAAVVFAILSAASFSAAIWPRSGASYGVGLANAVQSADGYDDLTFRRAMARSLVQARNNNAAYLAPRQLRIKLGIFLFAASVACVAWMIAAGAFAASAAK
jgi:hypothetical protein